MLNARTLGLCACLACALAAAPKTARAAAAEPPRAQAEVRAATAAGSTPLAELPKLRAYAGTRPDGSGLPPLHHVGMVVRDRDRTLANLTDALGFGPTYTFEGYFDGVKLDGAESGFGVRGGWVMMHNTALEIVEPTDAHGPHALYLAQHGEGLHHMAYWVPSVADEIAAMARGRAAPRLVADATGPDQPVPWCYVEGVLAGPTLIELIERNPGSEAVYAQVFGAIGGAIPG